MAEVATPNNSLLVLRVKKKCSKRKDRVSRMSEDVSTKVPDSTEDDDEEENYRRQRPPKKIREILSEPLYEEDIIEGFSFSSFESYQDLESVVKWCNLHSGKYPDPYSKLKFETESSKNKKKKRKRIKNENNSLDVHGNTKDSSCSSSEKGYICDNDSDDDNKGSDNGVGDLFKVRKLDNKGSSNGLLSNTAPPPTTTTSSTTTSKTFFRPYSISPPPRPNNHLHPAYRPHIATTSAALPYSPYYPHLESSFPPSLNGGGAHLRESYVDPKPPSSSIPLKSNSSIHSSMMSSDILSSNLSSNWNTHSSNAFRHRYHKGIGVNIPSSTAVASTSDDIYRRHELNSRFPPFHSLDGRTPLRRPPHLASNSHPSFHPNSSSLASSSSLSTTLTKDVPMIGNSAESSPLYRPSKNPSGFPGVSGASPSFTTPSHQSPLTSKKSGKWNAMHIRIAWEIYNHQSKQQKSKSSSLVSSLSSSSSSSSSLSKQQQPQQHSLDVKEEGGGMVSPLDFRRVDPVVKGQHSTPTMHNGVNPLHPFHVRPNAYGGPHHSLYSSYESMSPYLRFPPSSSTAVNPFGGLGSLRNEAFYGNIPRIPSGASSHPPPPPPPWPLKAEASLLTTQEKKRREESASSQRLGKLSREHSRSPIRSNSSPRGRNSSPFIKREERPGSVLDMSRPRSYGEESLVPTCSGDPNGGRASANSNHSRSTPNRSPLIVSGSNSSPKLLAASTSTSRTTTTTTTTNNNNNHPYQTHHHHHHHSTPATTTTTPSSNSNSYGNLFGLPDPRLSLGLYGSILPPSPYDPFRPFRDSRDLLRMSSHHSLGPMILSEQDRLRFAYASHGSPGFLPGFPLGAPTAKNNSIYSGFPTNTIPPTLNGSNVSHHSTFHSGSGPSK